MKPIGIVAALHEELATVLGQLPPEQSQTVAGRTFWSSHWHGRPMVAVLSRVGKVAAATTASVLIEHFGVDAIVFTGTAGGLAHDVRTGDLVIASELLQHDMDASPLFPRHEVPLYGRARFATDPALSGLLAQASRAALQDPATLLGSSTMAEFRMRQPRLHQGLIVSGDRFVTTVAENATLRRELPDALAVEMEGAAVAQVCHDYKVPFAAIRTVSDRADDQAHVDFTRFVNQVASRYSRAILERYFQHISHT